MSHFLGLIKKINCIVVPKHFFGIDGSSVNVRKFNLVVYILNHTGNRIRVASVSGIGVTLIDLRNNSESYI